MRIKKLNSLIILLNFALSPQTLGATQVQEMLAVQKRLFSPQVDFNLFQQASKKIIDSLDKEIQKNSSTLSNQPGYKKLIDNQKKAKRLLFLHKSFSQCQSDNNLIERSFNAAQTAELIPCQPSGDQFQQIKNWSGDVTKAMERNMKKRLQAQLIDRSLKSNIRSQLIFEKRYANVLKSSPLSSEKLCQKLECSSDQKNSIDQYIEKLRREMSTKPSYSKEELKKYLNEGVDKLNSSLSKINLKGNERWYWFDKIDLPEKNAQYSQYRNQYLEMASDPRGALLMSSNLRDEMGELHLYNRDHDEFITTGKDQFSFRPHEKIKHADIEEAAKEISSKLQEHMLDLSSMTKEPSKPKSRMLQGAFIENSMKDQALQKNLTDLIANSPHALGPILLNSPELSAIACSLIKDIDRQSEQAKNRDELAIIAAAIGGGLLIATGVGAVVGGALLGGSLTAGLAAGGAALTMSAPAAIALGGAEAAYWTQSSFEKYDEYDLSRKAILSGLSDDQEKIEYQEAFERFKEARTNAVLAVGLSALDLSAVKAINLLKKAKGTSKVSKEEIDKLSAFYQRSSDPAYSEKLKKLAMKLDNKEDYDLFMTLSSQLPSDSLEKMFSMLRQLDSDEMVKVVKNAVNEAKNSCVK